MRYVTGTLAILFLLVVVVVSLRVHQGIGKLRLCTTPYWRLRLKSEDSKEKAGYV